MKKLLTWTLIFVLFSTLTYAITPDYYYRSGDTVDNTFQCQLETGEYCGAAFNCNLTLTAPNTSVVVDNQAYDNNINYYNYTLTPTVLDQLGDYRGDVCCTNTTEGQCSSFFLRVNSSGQEDNILLNLGVFGAFIAIIFFYLYLCFNIDEEKFFTKLVLIFVALGDVCGLLLLGIATQTDRFSFLNISEALFIVNALIILMLVLSYLYYVIKSYINKVQESA